MIDITASIYALLNADSDVTTLAGSRIWANHHTPPASYRPNDGPAVVFRPRGGSVDYSTAIHRVSYQFKCYGETDHASQSPQRSAWDLYEAVYEAINEQAVGRIRYGYCEVLGQYMEEVKTDWPFILAFFAFYAVNDA